MNAYELADYIEIGGENIDRKELATMLRQQADCIAELESKRQYRELSDEEMIGAIARGWCSEKNSMKVLDSDLVMAIADEIKELLKKASEK